MNTHKALGMIGLAARAGKIVSGEFVVEKAVKGRKACLVIIAEDASANTKKKFRNMCDYYRLPCYYFETKERLGHAIGKEFRASIACVEENMAKAITGQLESANQEYGGNIHVEN